MLPGVEDVVLGGSTVIPSAFFGAGLIADAWGFHFIERLLK